LISSPAARKTVPGAFERNKRKPPNAKRGLERHGAAAQHTVAFLQFLSIEALAAMWLAPSLQASPHNAETLQKSEKREWPLSTQRACRFFAALNAGQKFTYRPTFRAVRALVVPPERGQGTETGKFLIEL
jgi:hypothetical protein